MSKIINRWIILIVILTLFNVNTAYASCYAQAYTDEVASLSNLALGSNNKKCVTFPYLSHYSNANSNMSLYHAGIDIRANHVSTYSIVSGKVIAVGGSYGMVMIETTYNGSKVRVIYLHLSKVDVTKGTQVSVGTKLGTTGEVGSPGMPHLHIEVRINYSSTYAVGRSSCSGTCNTREKVAAITTNPVNVLGSGGTTVPTLGDMYDDYQNISIANVQSFLEQFPNGDLKDKFLHNRFNLDENNFYQMVTNWNLTEIRNGVFTMSPAEIIYYSAKENSINPVLLLAKIQQEQSIIERSATQHKLNRATGYGIPNSNPVGDPKYKSFLAQLTGLTYQFDKFRGQGLTFQQAYNKYTVDNTGQDASFSRFMDIYENYAVLMDEVIQGNVAVPSANIPIIQSPIDGSQGQGASIEFAWDNNNVFSNIASVEFTLRKVAGNYSGAAKGDYVGSCGRIVDGKGRGIPIGVKDNYSSALCGEELEPNQWYKWAVSLYFNNGANPSGFSAFFKTQDVTLPSSDYTWHGNGSIISYHGRLLSNNAGEDWPYGITQDVVQLHASTNKPVGFFQWQVNEDGCRNLKLDTDGLSSNVDITIGSWRNRDDDITFSNVQLPLVLGRSNTGYRFEMNNGSWYVVKVASRNSLSSDVQLNAYCTTASPTNVSYRLGGGDAVLMDGGYKWNGNASVISHLFRDLYSRRYENLGNDWPFGAFKDTLKVRRSSEKPVVFFQWQRDDVCSSLTFDAELSSGEKRVDIHVKNWSASNESATVHSSVTLPYTIYDSSNNGNWRVIQIKFQKPISYTANVTAKCSGMD